MATKKKTTKTDSPLEKDIRAQQEEVNERIYKGQQKVDHDLFKLKVASMRKNVSFNDKPEIVSFEHCHIFHTVDSYGQKQFTTNAVGGHFHEVTVIENPNGGVPKLEISEPKKWVVKKVRGRKKKIAVPVVLVDDEEGKEVDTHTHEFEYLGSSQIHLRKPNLEFAKFDSALRAKQQPAVEGVHGA